MMDKASIPHSVRRFFRSGDVKIDDGSDMSTANSSLMASKVVNGGLSGLCCNF